MDDALVGVVYTLAFEQDGTRLRAYPDGGQAVVWDITSGQVTRDATIAALAHHPAPRR